MLDQTAEDILERNPRFLTRSKNFPGFLSFGPPIVALEEVVDAAGSFHSKLMPLFPDDIISTGTPGAVHIQPGDVVESACPEWACFAILCRGCVTHGDP